MATIRKRGTKFQVRIQGAAQASKSFSSRADAEAWAKITEADIIRGLYIKRTDAEKISLRDALGRYLKEITPHKRGAFAESHRITAWQKDKLSAKTLASLRGVDFAIWRDGRLNAGKAPATVRLELAVVSNLFTIARKEWGFEGLKNPLEDIRMPRVSNSRNRLFQPGEEELLKQALEPVERTGKGQFGQGCGNPWIKPAVLLAIETAMRRGELLTLRWENVRLDSRVAHLPLTKNGKSRDVPLSSQAVALLETLPRPHQGQVFPITPNALKLGFNRVIARARRLYVATGGEDHRIMQDLHFHDLRHIAITRLAERLPNIVELASVSGHEDVRMLRRYYHPRAEDLARKLG